MPLRKRDSYVRRNYHFCSGRENIPASGLGVLPISIDQNLDVRETEARLEDPLHSEHIVDAPAQGSLRSGVIAACSSVERNWHIESGR